MGDKRITIFRVLAEWGNEEETPWVDYPAKIPMRVKRIRNLWLFIQKARTEELWSWQIQESPDGPSVSGTCGDDHRFSEELTKQCAEEVARKALTKRDEQERLEKEESEKENVSMEQCMRMVEEMCYHLYSLQIHCSDEGFQVRVCAGPAQIMTSWSRSGDTLCMAVSKAYKRCTKDRDARIASAPVYGSCQGTPLWEGAK